MYVYIRENYTAVSKKISGRGHRFATGNKYKIGDSRVNVVLFLRPAKLASICTSSRRNQVIA